MTALNAYVHLKLVVELPEDEYEADAAFDTICESVLCAVTDERIEGIYAGSVSIEDADTRGQS